MWALGVLVGVLLLLVILHDTAQAVPARLKFSFYGDAQIDRTLANLEAAADMRPAWEALAEDFLRVEARQFKTEGGYGSGGWAPLSPPYAKWKAAHYPGKTILRRTDELYLSLTVGPQVRVVEPAFMVLGSAVAHGEFHQAPRAGSSLPRRRPVELPEARRRAWVKAVQRFLVTGRAEAP